MPPNTPLPFGASTGWDLDPFQSLTNNASIAQAQIYAQYLGSKKKVRIQTEEEDMPSKPLVPKAGFTFGCDPEAFVFDGDKPVPAAMAGIPGTKEEPYEVLGGAVQVDGMAAEFNIDPVDNYEDWESNITLVVDQLKSLLPEGLELRFTSAVTFDEDVFEKADDYSKALGCMPDVDAWTGGMNPPANPENPYLRCAGGHLHVGWTENELLSDLQHMLNCQDLVKQFDWFLGGWGVLQDPDNRRRELYGRMGACRYKPYGVEYRVLSPFWVETKDLRLAVWNRMNAAINAMAQMFIPERLPKQYEGLLRTGINESKMDPHLLHTCEYPLQTLAAGQRRF